MSFACFFDVLLSVIFIRCWFPFLLSLLWKLFLGHAIELVTENPPALMSLIICCLTNWAKDENCLLVSCMMILLCVELVNESPPALMSLIYVA